MAGVKSFAPHETGSTADAVEGPSNRSFGLVVGAIMAAIGGLRFVLGHGGPVSAGAIAIGAVLTILGALSPGLLSTPNRLWMKLGLMLGMIITPIVMGLVYLTTFLPMGLALKASGKDPLRRKRRDDSYWIIRTPPGPDPQTMPNQF